MMDLEQKRSKAALEFLSKPVVGKSESELKNKIKELPSLIQKNGLVITLYHLKEKSFTALYADITKFLGGSEPDTFTDSLVNKSAIDLIPLTEEARNYAGWLKRIASVKLKGDDNE
jgi:CRISPR/Cas system CMR-associated protein Cmr5 small subunit